MNQSCELSNVAKEYIKTFQCILEEMIQGMIHAPLTDSISHNFIVQMIPHHKAAIRMCENLLQYTTCIPLQNIAEGIIKEQTKSIANMEDILSECGCLSNCKRDLCRFQQNIDCIMQTMFTEMKNTRTTNNINDTFMREMIPHHKGAIRMCETALKFDICSELVPILNAIISSQKRGVAQMEELLKCGC